MYLMASSKGIVMLTSLNDSMSLFASLGGLEDFKASGKGISG